MTKKDKILVVEDEFIVANDLRMTVQKAGYIFCGIASSVEGARKLIELKKPDWILLDIMLKGEETGIDLAKELMQKKLPFLYISANTNQSILEEAKATQPYGFLVKPFRERDLFVMLDIARYRHDLERGYIGKTGETVAIQAGNIIGSSSTLQNLLDKAAMVAPTDTSVLLLGESGTGKEKIAQLIHNNSSRKTKPWITVNCAALPLSLVESELFGHEKGAFTGAQTKRIGKFEQANGGTIFLDEIGELPLEVQVKLLRVLQEREFERVGGEGIIKTDVRIIAATNRNLEKEVADGRFRLDLYYRLNIFPVELPPLRERGEDIEELALFFVKKYAAKMGKAIVGISPNAMQQIQQYAWPGNIRELEHFIERNVILAKGSQISEIQLPSVKTGQTHAEADNHIKTLEEIERDHILQVLKACNNKVSGAGGAAEVLQIPATTLYSKMKKLGIKTAYQ